MPWIESHTVLIRHRKLLSLARDLRLKPVYVMGHLHALWHAALEQAEDGDLSTWTDEFIADAAYYAGNPQQFVALLHKHHWLEGRLIHDWMDYAGRYLKAKYKTSNPDRLKEIEEKHKRVKFDFRQTLDRQPTYQPTKPTLPNQPNQEAVLAASTPQKMSDEEFISSLRDNPAYAHVDLDQEFGKMDAWLLAHPGRKKTRRFIVNWLNKVEKPVKTGPGVHLTKQQASNLKQLADLRREIEK